VPDLHLIPDEMVSRVDVASGGVEICCGFAVLHWVDLPVYPPSGFDFVLRKCFVALGNSHPCKMN
jgi:hypothetical protein